VQVGVQITVFVTVMVTVIVRKAGVHLYVTCLVTEAATIVDRSRLKVRVHKLYSTIFD